MERRKTSQSKSSPLPQDYLGMVSEVFSGHFDAGMKLLSKKLKNPRFLAVGEVHSNEIVIAVSLVSDEQLAGTTIYASTDFDPKASAPTVQDLLAACIDAIGTIFGVLLSPEKPDVIEKLADNTLSSLEEVPFEWTAIETDQKMIYVKIDKSNPHIDRLADDWLSTRDSDLKEKELIEEEEVKSLFITGAKVKSGMGGPGSSSTH